MPEIPAPDTSALLVYGPLGTIAAVLLFFVLRYGPRLIEGHISFMGTCEKTQVKIAGALETLSENHDASEFRHAKTHKALAHIAHAGKEATTCPDTIKHLDRAIDELQK